MRLIRTSSVCGSRPLALPRAVSWTPPVDVLDLATGYVLRLDLPGVDEKAVVVDLDGDLLRVKGERKPREEGAGGAYSLRERKSGPFRRDFRLPDAVDVDSIEAKYDGGVLEIRIPKVERSRKIPIQ